MSTLNILSHTEFTTNVSIGVLQQGRITKKAKLVLIFYQDGRTETDWSVHCWAVDERSFRQTSVSKGTEIKVPSSYGSI